MVKKRIMTIKIDRELFKEVDAAAQLMPIPNRTAVIEGLLRYAIKCDKELTTYEKVGKGLQM